MIFKKYADLSEVVAYEEKTGKRITRVCADYRGITITGERTGATPLTVAVSGLKTTTVESKAEKYISFFTDIVKSSNLEFMAEGKTYAFPFEYSVFYINMSPVEVLDVLIETAKKFKEENKDKKDFIGYRVEGNFQGYEINPNWH